MSEPNAENDIDAGLLLQELRNVNPDECEDEDEIEREQRERMGFLVLVRNLSMSDEFVIFALNRPSEVEKLVFNVISLSAKFTLMI